MQAIISRRNFIAGFCAVSALPLMQSGRCGNAFGSNAE